MEIFYLGYVFHRIRSKIFSFYLKKKISHMFNKGIILTMVYLKFQLIVFQNNKISYLSLN